MRGDRLSPVARYVRSLGDYYRVSEAAAVLDVSPDFLRGLANRNAELGPVARTRYGGGTVWLYTADRISTIHDHLRQHPPKRQARLWSQQEYKNRQTRSSLVAYYKERAKKLDDAGKPARAAQARRKASELAAGLEQERTQRAAKVGRPRWF